MEETKYRISSTMAIFIVSAALALDIVEFLLDLITIGAIFNRVLSLFASLIFFTWFALLGVKFTKNPSNLNTLVVGMAIELIPGLDLLPAWTVLTIRLIYLARKEDTQAAASGKSPTKKIPGKKRQAGKSGQLFLGKKSNLEGHRTVANSGVRSQSSGGTQPPTEDAIHARNEAWANERAKQWYLPKVQGQRTAAQKADALGKIGGVDRSATFNQLSAKDRYKIASHQERQANRDRTIADKMTEFGKSPRPSSGNSTIDQSNNDRRRKGLRVANSKASESNISRNIFNREIKAAEQKQGSRAGSFSQMDKKAKEYQQPNLLNHMISRASDAKPKK